MNNISTVGSLQNEAQLSRIFLIVLLISGLFLSSTEVIAQNLKKMNPAISEMKNSGLTSVTEKANRIEDLFYNLQPSVYINNNKIESFGQGRPVRAEVDIQSLSLLSAPNELFGDIELLIIRISTDGRTYMPAPDLTKFGKLETVIILCDFNCDENLINQRFSLNVPQGVTLLYQVSIPE